MKLAAKTTHVPLILSGKAVIKSRGAGTPPGCYERGPRLVA